MLVLVSLGAAGGIFMATINTAVMSSLGPGLHGFASGLLETVRQLGHGPAIPILTASLASGAGGTAMAQGAPFSAGFRPAMLVMAGIVLEGVLLAASRRPAPAEAAAKSAAAVLAAP